MYSTEVPMLPRTGADGQRHNSAAEKVTLYGPSVNPSMDHLNKTMIHQMNEEAYRTRTMMLHDMMMSSTCTMYMYYTLYIVQYICMYTVRTRTYMYCTVTPIIQYTVRTVYIL